MANAHTPQDLAQMQALPLDAKIRMTKERIKAWYESWHRFEIVDDATGKTRFVTMDCREFGAAPTLKETEWIKSEFAGAVYVSFSGGKDSTVLKHIVDSMYDDVPALFVNTGLEYPEIQRFAMAQKNVITVRPEMRFDEVLKIYGYPVISKSVADAVHGAKNSIKKGVYSLRLCQFGVSQDEYGGLKNDGRYEYEKSARNSKFSKDKWRYLLDSDFMISSQCCDVMKKRPALKYQNESGRMPILGTMTHESMLRETAWLRHGCNAFEKDSPSSQPLSFWTEQDILHYIQKYNVPICAVYGDITIDDSPEIDGQMNIIDYLGDYEETDRLKTTGCTRTGCIFCMFGCHLEKSPNRFQRLKQTHPRQYRYCIGGGEMVEGKWRPSKEGLGLGKVLDYIGVKY